ncbi:MAG: hypothetical protein E6767_01470 [Dysgonomonas sp.]|nr:hypothetical protein [Dysgonomonas sp.]
MNWKEAKDSGKDGFYWWYLNDKIPTQFPYDEIEVVLVSEDNERKIDIHQFDLQHIEAILNKTDEYITQAIDYIKDCIRKLPEQFQLTKEEMDNYRNWAKKNQYIQIPDNNVEQYLSFSTYDFPVSMPNIIFYPDKTWMIRFVESGLPTVNYGHGIGIFFNERNDIYELEIFPEE